MLVTTISRHASISVIDRRCNGAPADEPFAERHGDYSVSYVRRGSFGYRTRGESFELVAGSILVGHPGDEYVCTHDHRVSGDECLSFHLGPALVDTIGDRIEVWRAGCVPPLPELMVLGELAQAAAEGRSDVGVDEVGMLFAARFAEVVWGRERKPPEARVIATARWSRRSGWTRIRTSPSISRARRERSGSVRFTS